MGIRHSTFKLALASTLVMGTGLPSWGQEKPPTQSNPAAAQASTTLRVGHFVGVVKTLWDDNGRDMTTLEDFSYVDAAGVVWKAPAGSLTDGASIPQIAWSVVGGPFEGRYRKAAVVHDAACRKKDRSWESVHLMFYHAMLTAQVDETQAKIMYAAVFHYGPRWELTKEVRGALSPEGLNNLKESLQATNSTLGIPSPPVQNSGSQVCDPAHNSCSQKNPSSLKTVVRFVPEPYRLTPSDFESLKAMITSREAQKPGSVSLEEIRNFSVTP